MPPPGARPAIGTLVLQLGLVATIAATVGCDRVTKHVATAALAGRPARSLLADTIRLGYVQNAGGFLSLGADLPETVRTSLFVVATGVLLLALVAYGIRLRWRGWAAFGLALFVAGGVSNWVDRVLHGSVIDFINVGVGPLRTGVFNVADVAILLGVAIVLISEFTRPSIRVRPDPR
ncbi:MAG TPA: signal peptidase II [Vicinamibacterales bacterium]|nr:signal peptidase II [Vicinamibacterales bacterium]